MAEYSCNCNECNRHDLIRSAELAILQLVQHWHKAPEATFAAVQRIKDAAEEAIKSHGQTNPRTDAP